MPRAEDDDDVESLDSGDFIEKEEEPPIKDISFTSLFINEKTSRF